jgi:cytochrome c biogenesis protein CcdA
MKRQLLSIETLHLIAGFSLVISGLIVFFIEGIEMALSWSIFGVMYISMSDIGEEEMSEEKRNSPNHLIRRIFGYIGAILSVFLMIHYMQNLLQL